MTAVALPPAVARRADPPQTAPLPTVSPTSAAIWFTLTATLVSGVAPLLLVSSTPLGGQHSGAWPLAWLFAIAAGLRFSWVVGQGAQRLFEVVFWLFTYIFLGLAPMLQMRSGVYPETIPFLDVDYNARAMGVIAVGAASAAFGMLLAGSVNGRRAVRAGSARVPTAPHRLLTACVASLMFSSAYVLVIGPGTLFLSRNERSAIEAAIFPATINAIVKASSTLPLIICFAALMRLRQERREQGRVGPTVLPIVVLVMLLLVVNPASVPRYYAGTALLAVLAAVGATRTPTRGRVFALTLAFSLVIVFPYASATRTAETLSLADLGGPAQTLTTADYDAFDQINNGVAYVEERGAQRGTQVLGAALFAVPRDLWTSKPIDTGPLLAEYRAYKTTNLSSPLWAEFFVDGGWLGLIIGMGAFGALIRRLDLRALGPYRSTLAAVVPFYLIIVLRGPLLQAMAGLTVLTLTGLFVSGRRGRAPSRLHLRG